MFSLSVEGEKWMRRRHIMVAFVLLLALTICQVSAWSVWKPKHIQGFHVVKRLAKSMVAGSTYTWEVSLVNPK
jgi:cytochrome bd-type quinol oxidase subunit 1